MTSHFADQAASTSDGSQPPLLFDGYDLDEDEAPSGVLLVPARRATPLTLLRL